MKPLRAALLAAASLCASAGAAQTPPPARPGVLADAVAGLSQAWNKRDVAAYLAAWNFPSEKEAAAERAFASARLQESAESHLTLFAPATVPDSARRAACYGELVTTRGHRGKVEQLVVRLERGPRGWAAVSRQVESQLDGLAHLSLDSAGKAARGQVLRLPDFEMEMTSGTIFFSPADLGPTALVFVGNGRVRLHPTPLAEREQLRKYYDQPQIDAPLKLAFVRIAPEELHDVLAGPALEDDPDAAARWPAARRYFDDHDESGYVLDATVRGSPWWTMPPSGDALVVFDYGSAPLTLSISSGAAEGVNLFDRAHQRQICLYPRPGRPRDFDEDEGRRTDLRHVDLRLTLQPEADTVQGEATLFLTPLATSGATKLRLSDSLIVDSVTSPTGRRYLFFRLRRQNTLIVATGAQENETERTLIIKYHGILHPPPFEREPSSHEEPPSVDFPYQFAPPLVLAQPTAWYPQPERDDFATGTIEVVHPADFMVIGPGRRTTSELSKGKTTTRLEVDQPVKYLTIAIGKLVEAGQRDESGVTLTAFAVPRLKKDAGKALDMARSILRLFTTEFGPCPYDNLQIVLIEAPKPGGHSPPGVVLIAQRPALLRKQLKADPGNFSDVPGFFLAHELAHQWWGDGVAGNSYHDRWLSEASAHYAAALWARRSRGEEAFQGVMRDMAQWGISKNEAGPISLGYRIGHLEKDSSLFRAVVYDKGACVLHMLRQMLGDAAFSRGLVRFQEKYRFQKAGTPQLREALEESAQVDLKPYFESWIYGIDVPTLTFSAETVPAGRRFATIVSVSATALPGPVPLTITLQRGRGREVRVQTLPPQGGKWRIETDYRPDKVRINEDAGLLARIRG